jgi:DNA-binding transcriptional LysR family regulator
VTVSSVTEAVALVAAGAAVAAVAVTSVAVESLAPLPGVCYLRIDDWPGSTVALAWPAEEPSPVVAGFVELVRTVRDRERALVERIERRRPKRSTRRP